MIDGEGQRKSVSLSRRKRMGGWREGGREHSLFSLRHACMQPRSYLFTQLASDPSWRRHTRLPETQAMERPGSPGPEPCEERAERRKADGGAGGWGGGV